MGVRAGRRRWNDAAMTVAALPWRPPRASWWEGALAAWLDGRRWPAGGALGRVRWARAATWTTAEVAARLAEPSAVAVAIEVGGARAVAIAPWPLVAALVGDALGAPVPATRPRPPSPVERALVAAAVADALVRAGVAATVGLAPPVASGPAPVVFLAVEAAGEDGGAELAVLVPGCPPAPARSLATLWSRAARLPAVPVVVELARGAIAAAARARLDRLAAGDVVLVGRSAPRLLLGRGWVRGALDLEAGELTVLSTYQRAADVSTSERTPDPTLADDLAIPLTVVAGEVAVSARALLELAPGAVLSLGRPLGGAVELRAGARAIARGELVELDGALGVRVTEVHEPALVDGADAVLVPAR